MLRLRTNHTARKSLRFESLEDRRLLAGLVSWWTADNTAADAVGTNHGTLVSGATYAPGHVGQAFSFDGVDDRVQVADSPSLKLTQSLTIEAWLRVDSFSPTQPGEIFFRGDDRGGLDPYKLQINPDGTIAFGVTPTNGQGVFIAAPVPIGQFFHAAATLDDATGAMRLYINGVVKAQTTTTVRPFGDLDPTKNPSIGIGNHGGWPTTPNNLPFHGLIDELKVYDASLSAVEVLANYNASIGGPLPSITISDATAIEGSMLAVFTVTLSSPSAVPVTVDFNTANGSALSEVDYTSKTGIVVFAPGQTTQTILVQTLGDSVIEAFEIFNVNLSNAVGGIIADVQGVGTIENNLRLAGDYDGNGSIDDADRVVWRASFGQIVLPGTAADGNGNGVVDSGDYVIWRNNVGATTTRAPRISISDATVTEGDDTPRLIDVPITATTLPSQFENFKSIIQGPDGDYYVTNAVTHSIMRFDGTTFQFKGTFVSAQSGGLDNPIDLVFVNGDLLVSSANSNSVLRYDGETGAFLGAFVPAGAHGIQRPTDMLIYRGALYVGAWSGDVHRYDLNTGAFIDKFVDTGSGGLNLPVGLAFGPDGNFYVADYSETASHAVLRYDGLTGNFLNVFISDGSGGLTQPAGMKFGPDGNLYVVNSFAHNLLRYAGGTGQFLNTVYSISHPGRLIFKGNQILALTGDFALDDRLLRLEVPTWAVFNVTLDSPSDMPVNVDFTVASGTASLSDYVATAGRLTFAPGETTKTIVVATRDDAIREGNETFFVNLSNPVGGLISDGQGIGTITDNDQGLAVGSALLTSESALMDSVKGRQLVPKPRPRFRAAATQTDAIGNLQPLNRAADIPLAQPRIMLSHVNDGEDAAVVDAVFATLNFGPLLEFAAEFSN